MRILLRNGANTKANKKTPLKNFRDNKDFSESSGEDVKIMGMLTVGNDLNFGLYGLVQRLFLPSSGPYSLCM